MSLIDIKGLTFSYDGGSETVFDDVSFTIDTDWRTGLIGRNGRGKTTLLKLLAGEYEYRGKITSSVGFTYFPFDVKDDGMTAGEILSDACPDVAEWAIARELSLLNVDDGILYMPFRSLSGGERTKVLLAGLFARDDGFLLIDEPTDHLDAVGRESVARYLQRKSGFILVSHDRAFLDLCVDHIVSIGKTEIEVRSGDFSSWQTNYERRVAYETAQNERLKKDIARLAEAEKRTAEWADKTESAKYGKASSGLKQDKGYVGHKAAKLMKRAKTVGDRRKTAIEQKSELLRNVEKTAKLKLSPLDCRAERLVTMSDVRIFYDGVPACGIAELELFRGERVALHGGNGCGKSSVLKLVAGESLSFDGAVKLASGLIVSYVPQSTSGMRGGLSAYAKIRGIDESLFKTVLRKLDFRREDLDVDISTFSQGRKKKVALAASLCEKAHLYVWDEPLNYVDIYSRMQLEELLLEFAPTMLFVEHDKAFRDAVATRIVEMR